MTIARRIEKLTARLRVEKRDGFTFEQICRMLWVRDRRGFLTMASGDCPLLRGFVYSFQREDADRRGRKAKGRTR